MKIFFYLNGQDFVDEMHVAWNIVNLKNCYKSLEHSCESCVCNVRDHIILGWSHDYQADVLYFLLILIVVGLVATWTFDHLPTTPTLTTLVGALEFAP